MTVETTARQSDRYSITDLLSDPVMRLLMARDGVGEEELRALLRAAAARQRAKAGEGLLVA